MIAGFFSGGKKGLVVAGGVALEVVEPSAAGINIDNISRAVVCVEWRVIVKVCRLCKLSWLAMQDCKLTKDKACGNVMIKTKQNKTLAKGSRSMYDVLLGIFHPHSPV